MESSAENPQPLRVVTSAVRGWIDRLGAIWVEAQVIEINRRAGSRTVFVTMRDKLANERSSLSRWMARLKRAFHSVEKLQQRIARLERQITRHALVG